MLLEARESHAQAARVPGRTEPSHAAQALPRTAPAGCRAQRAARRRAATADTVIGGGGGGGLAGAGGSSDRD